MRLRGSNTEVRSSNSLLLKCISGKSVVETARGPIFRSTKALKMALKLQTGMLVLWHGLKQYVLCLQGGEHGRVSEVVH